MSLLATLNRAKEKKKKEKNGRILSKGVAQSNFKNLTLAIQGYEGEHS